MAKEWNDFLAQNIRYYLPTEIFPHFVSQKILICCDNGSQTTTTTTQTDKTKDRIFTPNYLLLVLKLIIRGEIFVGDKWN